MNLKKSLFSLGSIIKVIIELIIDSVIKVIIEPITGQITGSEHYVLPDLSIINCEESRQVIIEAVKSGAIPFYGERRQIIIEALKNGESVQIPITV